ncbi:hypothetical protein [Halorussus amylolyticus]|uniref:hypothetical protein n=1 Tax=Halorussus amylolyticus TaxID=1126242 RepID=UPI00104DC634|nr:hypothetical protein [Halorussus amylolyticus]
MDPEVPVSFALLGILAGIAHQFRNALPELLSYPSTEMLQYAFLAFGAVGFAVSTLAAAALGYRANRWAKLPDEYARFGSVAGVASGVGFLLGVGAVLLVTSPAPVADSWLFSAVVVSYDAVTKAVSIGLVGLAGASVAHFRDGR